MPELPEVEIVCRGLNQVTLNQNITGGDVLLQRTIAHPLSLAAFWQGVLGRSIAQWQRRGKYLLAQLVQGETQESAGWLGVHLRMTGQLLWKQQSDPVEKHSRVRFFLADGQELRFVDQRTFGQIWWVPPNTVPEQVITGLRYLGPEPFSPEFSPEYFAQQLHNRQRSIKNALLDQAIVAGIGNIYADEALFKSGIHPTTLCSQLSPAQITQLRSTIVAVLQASIAAGGTTFSNFLNVQGVNGNYGGEAWVYHRDGQPCRTCTTPIQRLKLAGRSAHFCPQCQSL